MQFTIRKTVLGKYAVKFDCPKCKARLSAPLDQAGSEDTCPDCHEVFVVPGRQKLDQLNLQKQTLADREAALAVEKEQERIAAVAARAAQAAQERRIADAKRIEAAAWAETEAQAKRDQESHQLAAAEKQMSEDDQRARVQPSKERYPALHRYAPRLRVLGWIVFIGGALWAVVGSAIAISTNDGLALASALGLGFGLNGMGAGFVITAELIMVLLDIEANTRRMR